MNIHLLSGFLGSGKTTAIANAATQLMKAGKRVGVITNDQGKYQVDSQFINARGVPVVEVSNGCFCCNYEQLDEHILTICKEQEPDYIFAESVGSCTDIVATVLKPLQTFRKDLFNNICLSTFADARMLLLFLNGRKLPFNEEVNYIIEKQYEEADLLIVNKIDLLQKEDKAALEIKVKEKFPDKGICFQNSQQEADIAHWITTADQTLFTNRTSLDIDYGRYAYGEALLGWLDQTIQIKNAQAPKITDQLINLIYKRLQKNDIAIGHLKFIISYNNKSIKRSFTSFAPDPQKSVSDCFAKANNLSLLINARVQCSPDELSRHIEQCITETEQLFGVQLSTKQQDSFAPGFPKPLHRIQ